MLLPWKEVNLSKCFIAECTALDKLEKASQTVKGANNIVEDSEALSTVISPIKTWLTNPPSSPR
jgi:fused-like protein